jgi:hypothetical protein
MPDAIALQVLDRPDREYARRSARIGQIAGRQTRMGIGRAQHDKRRRVGKCAIIRVQTLTGQQAIVLDAFLRARSAEVRGIGVELDRKFRHMPS